MSDLYSEHAFGVWAPKAPVFQPHALQLFWDPVAGSDNNPGTNRLRPVKTAEKIRRLIPLVTGNVDINMKSGSYVLPADGVFLGARTYTGLVRFRANADWDPTVFTVLKSQVAQAGTTDQLVVLSGMTVDAFRGLTVEVTSAADPTIIQKKTIRGNTATDIVPVETFIFPIAPGDAVRVLRTNAIFQMPAGGVAERLVCVFADDGLALSGSTRGLTDQSIVNAPTGLALEGVGLDRGDVLFFEYGFGRLPLYLYGVEAGIAGDFDNVFNWYGTEVHAGCDLDTQVNIGWGVSNFHAGDRLGTVDAGGVFIGYNVSLGGPPATLHGTQAILYGGRCTRIFDADVDYTILGGFDIPYLVSPTSGPAITVQGNRSSLLMNGRVEIAGVAGGIFPQAGATVTIGSDVTGNGDAGDAVNITGGARVLCLGAVNFGDAVATDWVAFGSPGVNKSFFAALGDTLLGTDGVSYAIRTA